MSFGDKALNSGHRKKRRLEKRLTLKKRNKCFLGISIHCEQMMSVKDTLQKILCENFEKFCILKQSFVKIFKHCTHSVHLELSCKI